MLRIQMIIFWSTSETMQVKEKYFKVVGGQLQLKGTKICLHIVSSSNLVHRDISFSFKYLRVFLPMQIFKIAAGKFLTSAQSMELVRGILFSCSCARMSAVP